MNGAAKALIKVSGEQKTTTTTTSSSDLNGPPPHESSLVLATRSSRQLVSYWTCSKLCAICFVGGVVFGYTLRGRVKRWASKLLKKLT